MPHFWSLVFKKIGLNLKSEASSHVLNYAWWVLEPGLQLAVYYVVFDRLLQRGTDNYAAFLMIGIVFWLWFAKTVSNSCLSILGGKYLIYQVAISKIFFPLVVVGQDAVKQLVVMFLLFLVLAMIGFPPSMRWLLILPVFVTQFALIAAVSLTVSYVVAFYRDVNFLVSALMTLAMFASGVFFSYEEVLIPVHRDWFLANPMATILVSYRFALMGIGELLADKLILIFVLSTAWIAIMTKVISHSDSALSRAVVE